MIPLVNALSKDAVDEPAAAGYTARTDYRRLTPPLVNHPVEAERALRAASEILGPGGVTTQCRTMGGADFPEFLERVPGAFAFARDVLAA
jgi:metal-dependent amidase/aminoacylase/carboxypeptidase family protein